MTKGSPDNSWRNRFLDDSLDPSGGNGSSPSNVNPASQSSFGGAPGGSTPANQPDPTSTNESGVWVGDLGALNQAPSSVDSGSGGGSGGSTPSPVSGSGSSFVINVIYDSSVSNAPPAFTAAIQDAVSYLESIITTPITVNIDVGYGEIDGQALESGALGESETYLNSYSYSSIKTALAKVDPLAAATLPVTAPGQMWLSDAQAEALGLAGTTNSGTVDAYAGFSSVYPFTYNPNNRAVAGEYDFIGVVEHEFTEDMGRIDLFGESLGGGQSGYSLLDLYHYTSPGVHTYTGTVADYFSVNAGVTNLDYFNSNPSGDLGDWAASAGDDSFLAFSPSDEADVVSQTDVTEMNALGFEITGQNSIVVSGTTSDALQGGSSVQPASAVTVIDSNQTLLVGATVKIANGSGATVAGDELAVDGVQNGSVDGGLVLVGWNSSTNTLTLTGVASIAEYDTLLDAVSYQDTGTDTSSGSHPVRTVTWTASDGTNNYSTTSQITVDRVPVANNVSATDATGATVTATAATGVVSDDSDLDGDILTVVGVSDTAHGAGTVGQALAGVYGSLTLNSNGSYSYIASNTSAINGAAAGSAPIDAFAYTISDGNGGTASATLLFTVDRPPVVTASNVDLSTGHASVAASSLLTVSDLDGNAIASYEFTDTGPGEFLLNGAAQPNNQDITVTAAQLPQLTYQSVLGQAADTVQVRAYDGTLWSSWESFTVTAPPLVIRTDTNSYGTTNLVEVGGVYALYGTGGSGPDLIFNGTPVTVGQLSPWAPLGAAPTSTGYDVAWENTANDTYTVWNVNSSGNYTANLFGAVPGNNLSLEQLEPVFNQDLNGDGTIGPPPPTIIQTDTNSYGTTNLVEVGGVYALYGTGGSGPDLIFNGTPVTVGQLSPWAPLGAAPTSTGYDVAWENTANDTYTVWNVNSSGNYTANLFGAVPGNNLSLEQLEPVFNQDLNGDGTIGPPPPTIIQTDTNSYGTTNLVEVGGVYALYGTGGSGPDLIFNGTPVTVGQLSPWAPLGAAPTSTGYDVAWENTANDTYTVWNVNSSGNYTANLFGAVPGNNLSLEQLEPVFNQDLNGDGTIGPPPPTIIQTDTNSYGTTNLVEVGGVYALYGTGGSGPDLIFNGTPVTVGQLSPWAPLGAAPTSTGYDVAWENTANDTYTVWNVNSSGNYTANLFGAVPGNNLSLEQLEPVFNQDLNGDGVLGIYAAPGSTLSISQSLSGPTGTSTIGSGATLELAAADSASVTFQSSTGTLALENPSTFSGEIYGFSGNGTLSGSDQIDLTNIQYASVHDSYSAGVLTVTDGNGDSDTLTFSGSYSLSNFEFASNGSNGTILFDPPVAGSNSSSPGQATAANWHPAGQTAFGSAPSGNGVGAPWTVHDDWHGSSGAPSNNTLTLNAQPNQHPHG